MAKSKSSAVTWLTAVQEHNYPAAASYLSLLLPAGRVRSLVSGLRRAPITQFKAKDIFRASGLSLLGVSNGHVEKDLDKIRSGESLAPILLVRDPQNGKVVVADGYHRMCAVYQLDEDAWIRCKIV